MKNHSSKLFALVLLVGCVCISCNNRQQKASSGIPADFVVKDYLSETKADKDTRMAWWREARFGMFIHWGLYSIPAGEYNGNVVPGIAEWIMETGNIPTAEYEKYAAQFNPINFDPAKWVKLAKDAGMKYIVITSKHHDGFCLWDSKVSNYDIMDATPYQKDIIKALADECHKQGIRFCIYHSIMDWHHPDANPKHIKNTKEERMNNFPKYTQDYLKPQLYELLTNYGDVGVLWFDGEWIDEWTADKGKDLYNFLRTVKPDLIVNNRVGKDRDSNSSGYCGDFGTPEQEILEGTSDNDWESCMTMNDTWGFKKSDNNWKSAKVLIHNLVDIASKGGNYLMNVGPTAEGQIPEASVERLEDMGKWMRVNGEAIYGTHAIKRYKEGENIRFTQSSDNKYIYIFSLEQPGKTLNIRTIKPTDGSEIYLLGYGTPLKWTYNLDNGLTIELPGEAIQNITGPLADVYTFKVQGGVGITDMPKIGAGKQPNAGKQLFTGKKTIAISASQGSDVYYTTDGSEPTIKSKKYTAPFDITGDTEVKAFASSKGRLKSETVSATYQKTAFVKGENPKSTTPGLNYEYFQAGILSVKDLAKLQPAKKGTVETLLTTMRETDDKFAVRYTGYLYIDKPALYTLSLASDDGSRMVLNGKEIITNDGPHAMREVSTMIALEKGYYPVVIEYFDDSGSDGLNLYIESEGMPRKEAGPAMWFH